MPARPIRIALFDLPRMVEDIVGVLMNDAPDADVVACYRHRRELARSLDRGAADLVICAVDEPRMEVLWNEMLKPCELPAFLNLGGGFAHGDLYFVHATRRRLDEVSAESLAAALRDRDSWTLRHTTR